MAIKAISQFDAATPTSNDKILFEQNGEGKSAALADLPVSTKTQDALGTKVNTSNVLTLEQIQASTNLKGKLAGADSIKTLVNNRIFKILCFWEDSSSKDYVVFKNVPIGYRECGIAIGNANGNPFFRYFTLFLNGEASQNGIDSGTISTADNGDGTANVTISPVDPWGRYNLVVFYGYGY